MYSYRVMNKNLLKIQLFSSVAVPEEWFVIWK